MEMQQLRHFVAAAQHGNIGRAAQELNITQPALSRSIKNLEASLGAELLERGARGVRPTIFGESMLEHAQVILREVDRAVSEVQAIQGLSQGQFTIGIAPAFSSFIVPEAIGQLNKDRPGINITVTSAFYDELLASLRRAEFDLVFSMFPPVNSESDLEFEALYVSRSGVHARSDHPLAKKEKVSMAELAEYGWVVPNQFAVNRIFRSFFTDNGLPTPRQVIRTTSLTYLKQAMTHSGLLSILPDHLIADEVTAGDIVKINNSECVVESLCGIITRQNRSRPPAVLACMEALRAACKDIVIAQGGKGDPNLPYSMLT